VHIEIDDPVSGRQQLRHDGMWSWQANRHVAAVGGTLVAFEPGGPAGTDTGTFSDRTTA
jgi:hypothetical protein